MDGRRTRGRQPHPAGGARGRKGARPRRGGSCTGEPPENAGWTVGFAEPQRAPAPGQAAVLYDGELVRGGGTICEML